MKTKTLTFLSILIFLFLINFVSSTASWSQYGGAELNIYNTQFNGFGNVGNIKNISIAQGYNADNTDIAYQPLVFYSAVSGKYYLVIQNGNYLQIYDKDLNLVTEINTVNKTTGQIAEFNNAVNSKHHIVGWYNTNSSLMTYKDYYFNPTTELLSLNYSLEVYNVDNPLLMSTRGVRCWDGNYNTTCYSLIDIQNGSGYYNLILFQNWVNSSNDSYRGYMSDSLLNQFSHKPLTPLSSAFFSSDNTLNYLAYSEEEVYVLDGGGGDVLFKTNTNSSKVNFAETTSSIYTDLIIANSSSVGKYRISDGSLVSSYATYCNPVTTQSLCSGIADYNGDGYDDIFYSCQSSGSNWWYALKGSDLSVLASGTQQVDTSFSGDVTGNCIVAKMHGLNPFYDIVYGSKYNLRVKSLASPDGFLLSRNSTAGNFANGLAVADMDNDGFNDIITSSLGKTEILFSNYTAQLPVLSSVTYDPSTSILARTTLIIYIVASDTQGFPIQYGLKCSNTDSWVINTTSTKTCTYNNAGVYNLSISVGNTYRSDSITYSHAISVTETGVTCNTNGICEESLGETHDTCPSDCPEDTTTGGDLQIPLVLADTENTNQGLLPEIYYGTLAVLSNVLKPLIILVFVIFFVLIIMAIGTIIKKISMKVV